MYLQGFRYKQSLVHTLSALQHVGAPNASQLHAHPPFLLPVPSARHKTCSGLSRVFRYLASCAPPRLPPPSCQREPFFLFSPVLNQRAPNFWPSHSYDGKHDCLCELDRFHRQGKQEEEEKKRRACCCSVPCFFFCRLFLDSFSWLSCCATSSYIYLT